MAEEFQESEVIFSDHEHGCKKYFNYQEMGVFSNNNKKEDYGGEDLVPPHIIVERRIPGKMAFSVCTGNGRTLKGRDLSEAVHIVPLQSNTVGSLSSWFLRDPGDGVIDFQDLTFREMQPLGALAMTCDELIRSKANQNRPQTDFRVRTHLDFLSYTKSLEENIVGALELCIN
ncbi:hypothetical protein NC651_026025 [Populus alba x Populus x berolinensis]|nr:hypothetical protein NC651_026025 [Populus alba x Populus x berolinensis]